MESTPVNWEALDSLVISFAKSEHLIEDSSALASPSSSPSSSSSYQYRLLIRQIRRSIEAGDVDGAIYLLREHVPVLLDDHRILFRLQKQVRPFSHGDDIFGGGGLTFMLFVICVFRNLSSY